MIKTVGKQNIKNSEKLKRKLAARQCIAGMRHRQMYSFWQLVDFMVRFQSCLVVVLLHFRAQRMPKWHVCTHCLCDSRLGKRSLGDFPIFPSFGSYHADHTGGAADAGRTQPMCHHLLSTRLCFNPSGAFPSICWKEHQS